MWPMIAGIGASVAAAGTVGQMIVAAMQYGNSEEADRRAGELLRRVEALEQKLQQHRCEAELGELNDARSRGIRALAEKTVELKEKIG
ncbi:hypothetical protein BU26DRAFT_525773 [Trematosphaeria pertusa]|uniref:Uncharacterized protein n=1 Tax=Trematosphaeria pertusa TaxID=390896 RepID=A0A6A6HSX7_9PLEO|nr:uncharacterized protein BU26DRAFT_525773 [Trematosphaeria pertusa]KAF2240878.1 hypothetical protein BU26DRAFT_525773 [Trematosphaeria pertusa]